MEDDSVKLSPKLEKNQSFAPILAASISGGLFPYQLEALRELCKHGFKPSLILGSSGGNVASYIAMAGRWTPSGIERVASELDPSYFIVPWYPLMYSVLPSTISGAVSGLFNGSLYESSPNAIKIFETYFAPNEIKDVEMWVGAVNEVTSSFTLFCNRAKEECVIQGKHFNRRMFKAEPLKYLNGDINRICKASIASSSIPVIVEAEEIDGQRYVDSGTKFSSPLTPLQNELKAIGKNNGGRIHIIYITGYDLEADLPAHKLASMMDRGTTAAEHLVRGLTLHDRATACEIIRDVGSLCDAAPYTCNTDGTKVHFVDILSVSIPEVYRRLKYTKTCLLELFPLCKQVLDYTNFNGKMVIDMMNFAHTQMAGHLWWTGDENIFNGIPGVTRDPEQD